MPRCRSPHSDSVPKEEVCDGSSNRKEGLSDYELQRLSRIEENRKRMAALGLPQIASSLMTGPGRRSARKSDIKEKRKLNDEDEDYEPNSDEDGGIDDDDDEEEDDAVDVDYEDENYSAPESTKRKGRRTISTPKKKTSVKKVLAKSDSVNDDDDDELMQAIALSLQGNSEMTSPAKSENASPKERWRKMEVQGGSQKGKSRRSFSSRVKMTEDELVLHFFQFDEAGKGSISMRDLEKVAIAHDFTWSDKELVDMIHYFDADGDGKLGLDDFQKIARRCNMIQGPD